MSGKVVKKSGGAELGGKSVLDIKDKKILRCLCEDARMPVSSISERTSLQRDLVVYRINKMKDQGVISSFRPVTNPPKMGLSFLNLVNFRLKNYSKEETDKFIKFLKNCKRVTEIYELSGEYDLMIIVASKDVADFDNVMKEIRELFSGIIDCFKSNNLVKNTSNDKYIDLT